MLKNMNARERLMVTAAGVIIAVTIGWLGVLEPAMERRATLIMKIETKKKEKQEVAALAQKYLAIERRLSRFESKLKAQPGGFSSLAVMESMAASAGLKENVVSMNPQPSIETEGYRESMVALKLEKVELFRLVAFLESIHDSKIYFRIKRISIKPQYENPEWLNVSLSVSGYEAIE